MNPLLEPIEDQDQLYLLGLLAKTFRERGHCPNWQFVEAMLERPGADPVGLVASLPSVGVRQGVYGFSYGVTWTSGSFGSLYAPADPMGLTIAGWHQVGASDVVGLFLAVLRLANRRLDDFVPDPDRVMAIGLSSTDVETELAGAFPFDSRQLYEILEAEPAMRSSGRSMSQSGEWRWELSKPLRRYRDVTTVEGYLDAVTAFAEEVAKEVKRLPFAQAFAVPSPTLVKDVLAVHENSGTVELGDASAASEAPVLFLSWGGRGDRQSRRRGPEVCARGQVARCQCLLLPDEHRAGR